MRSNKLWAVLGAALLFLSQQSMALASEYSSTTSSTPDIGYKIIGFSDAFDASSKDLNHWMLGIGIESEQASSAATNQNLLSLDSSDDGSGDVTLLASPQELIITALIEEAISCLKNWDSCREKLKEIVNDVVWLVSKTVNSIVDLFSSIFSTTASALAITSLTPAALAQNAATDQLYFPNSDFPFDGDLTVISSNLDQMTVGSGISLSYAGTLNFFGMNQRINPAFPEYLPIAGEIIFTLAEIGNDYAWFDITESSALPVGNNWGGFEKLLHGIDLLGSKDNLGVIDGVLSFDVNSVDEPNPILLLIASLGVLGFLRRGARRRELSDVACA